MTIATTLSIAEIEAHPSLLLDLFRKAKGIRFIVDPVDNEHVTVYPQRKYSEEAIQIVQEARAEYLARKATGYTRDEAKANFAKVWQEIEPYLMESDDD